MIVPIPDSGALGLQNFPLLFDGQVLSSWNVHYLNLERLPSLLSDNKHKLDWLGVHVGLGFSDRERRQKTTARLEMQPLTQVKEDVEKQIDLSFLESDEVLISYLEQKLVQSKA